MTIVKIIVGWALVSLAAPVVSSISPEPRPEAALARAQAEEAVPLDEVPAEVKQAALDAVPGLVLERASSEVEDGVVVYELEGTAGGKRVEVELAADGKVLEIETEDETEGETEGEAEM